MTFLLPVLASFAAAEAVRAEDIRTAEFSHSVPDELQFSDGVGLDGREEDWAKSLAKGEPADQLAAARTLWRGHSRRHAVEVLKYAAGPPPGGGDYRAFQREVEASFGREAVLRELREGDYRWGAWLAFLRPEEDFAPVLLAGLKDKPELLPETMLALGNSGDPRALKPLVVLLKSKDFRTAGDAAQALGYLGDQKAEQPLIDALAADDGWLRVKACGALAKLGTPRALPALERLAKDDSYMGVLNVQGMAQYAVESINKREKR